MDGVGELCVERNAGGAGDPPVPIGKEDGVGQTNPIAGHVVAGDGASEPVCGRKGGELYLYARSDRTGADGTGFGEYADWAVAVAGIAFDFGFTVLAGEIENGI